MPGQENAKGLGITKELSGSFGTNHGDKIDYLLSILLVFVNEFGKLRKFSFQVHNEQGLGIREINVSNFLGILCVLDEILLKIITQGRSSFSSLGESFSNLVNIREEARSIACVKSTSFNSF